LEGEMMSGHGGKGVVARINEMDDEGKINACRENKGGSKRGLFPSEFISNCSEQAIKCMDG
jgi:hypothetical protein